MAREAHVVPGKAGGWEVVIPGAAAASSRHNTQSEARSSAKRLLEDRGGGEAVIHGREGEIKESDRIASGPRRAKR
jgi:hypothetical protein